MHLKANKKSILKLVGCCFFILISSVASACLCLPTRDYKLDRVAYALNDYNKYDYYNGFQPSILRLHQNSKTDGYDNRSERYDDIFEQFYYNSFVKSLRQFATNDIFDEVLETKLNVFCQKTYLCRNSELANGGHYVDYGIFASYFGDELFENRPSEDPRSHAYYPYNDCVTFAYISDVFADSLIEFYKETEPESGINSYQDLIFKKPVLPIRAQKKNSDGSFIEYHINVSINNILYSDKRHANRITELYGASFALVDLYSYGRKTREWVDLVCEMDLKADPFGIKNVLQSLEYFEYNPTNTNYTFYKYNYSEKIYRLEKTIGSSYVSSFSGNISTTLFYCVSLVFIASFFALNFLFIRNDYTLRIITIICYGCILTIFGLITIFTYFYPLWSITPLTALIGGLIIVLLKRRRKDVKGGLDCFEINI